jgi:transcriptional regulator with XRE-family HTH domain
MATGLEKVNYNRRSAMFGTEKYRLTIPPMTESERLVATLKRLLKRQGFTYRRIAGEIGLSEQSVKRMFSKGTFTLDRLVQLASLLGMSLAEIAEQAAHAAPSIRTLTHAQEKELTAEPALLLVAACVLNGWTPDQIVATYRLSKAECLKRLLKLDRLGMITLLPGDRVRLNVARDFDWLHQGPIERFFRKEEKDDFLAGDFTAKGETLHFLFGLLSPAAKARLDAQIEKLRSDFADLHHESLAAPFDERTGACLLLAQRDWEPRSFSALRRGDTAKKAAA